jgi:hypothetical protein
MYVDKVLAVLDDEFIQQGAEDLMQSFYFTWQVCQGLGMAQGDELLAAAAMVIQSSLDKQPDPVLREVYLRQVHHRLLWEAWGKK